MLRALDQVVAAQQKMKPLQWRAGVKTYCSCQFCVHVIAGVDERCGHAQDAFLRIRFSLPRQNLSLVEKSTSTPNMKGDLKFMN